MSEGRFVPDRRAVVQLLRSPQLAALLERKANAIAAAAGEGMAVDAQRGGRRARASVRTHTRRAMRGEAKDRRLTRALTAGRRG